MKITGDPGTWRDPLGKSRQALGRPSVMAQAQSVSFRSFATPASGGPGGGSRQYVQTSSTTGASAEAATRQRGEPNAN